MCQVGDSQNKSRMMCHFHFCFTAKDGVLDIEIPLDYIKDRLKLYNIVQHRTTICTCMYLEAEVARKLFLPYEIKKFQRKKKKKIIFYGLPSKTMNTIL